MGSLSPIHLLLLLLVVVVIFGTGKLRNVGSDLGKAVKGFKDGMRGEEDKPAQSQSAPPQVADKSTVDVEVKEKTRS
ncbi:MAG TPA: Sec-independent protein translocase subunit TatA [Burkholderiaceae bacterium]